ncbi:MAG: acetylserotonin O-methyltransferase, partial [Bacteroidota bacterium]|nr:acetylserotonin O-methyltransferase [Bacteroidota bacterium]
MPTDITTEKSTAAAMVNPSKIMQIGMGFWASKVLLTAVKFELFTLLATGVSKGKDIKGKLGLRCTDRHVFDWLDTMVSLGFLERKGLLEESLYSNAEDVNFFLDKAKPSYMGGILEMANNRLYKHWNNLEDGLMTGKQQNETKDSSHGNMDFFTELYKDPAKLQEFMNAMSGIQTGNFITLANKFDFSKYKSLLDIGGADGWLCVQIAMRHPNIQCTTIDLAAVEPLAKNKIATFGLANRIKTASGDFLKDEFPT